MTYKGVGSPGVKSSTGGTTVSVPYPTGGDAAAAGDVLVAVVCSNSTTAPTTPAGWTSLGSAVGTGSQTPGVRICAIVADGTEAGGNLTVTVGSVTAHGVIVSATGIDTSFIDSTFASVSPSASTTLNVPTRTPTVSGDTILAGGSSAGPGGTFTSAISTTGGSGSGFTMTEQVDISDGVIPVMSVYSQEYPFTSATGTVVITRSSSLRSVGWMVLLKATTATNVNGDAALAATDTITADGIVGAEAGATSSSTATLSAAGQVGTAGDATLAATDTITTAGAVGTSTGASIAATGTISAAGSVAASSLTSTAAIAATDSITGAGVVGTGSGASIAATGTITATGVVTSGLLASASLSATDTINAAGVVGTATGSTIAATDTITGTGVVGSSTGAALAATDTIAGAGVVGKATGASIAATDTVSAAGLVGKSSTAAVSATAAVTATALVGKQRGASLSSTVHIEAEGIVAGNGVHMVAAADRLISIRHDPRLVFIEAESRVVSVRPESRQVPVAAESRVISVKPQDRVLTTT